MSFHAVSTPQIDFRDLCILSAVQQEVCISGHFIDSIPKAEEFLVLFNPTVSSKQIAKIYVYIKN